MTYTYNVAQQAATADERTTLEIFLDHHRDAVKTKVRGVSDEDARRSLVPSATTLGGIVKHLRWVELGWFQRALARIPWEELPPKPYSADDPDGDFRMEPDETLDGLTAEYDAQCAISREIAAKYQLDDTFAHRRGELSLRWLYLHMIEETARHVGHLDILREQLDGVIGD